MTRLPGHGVARLAADRGRRAASLALAASSAPPTAAAPTATKVLRYAFRGRRDRLRSGADLRPLFAHAHRQHLRGALRLRPPGPAGASCGRRPPTAHARGRRTTSGPAPIRIKPGIYFADDPAFKGKPRELTAADYVYSIKRHGRPARKSPTLHDARGRHRRPRRAAQGGAAAARALRLRHARSRACRRSTATRCSSGSPSPTRASSPAALTRRVAGAVAREVVEFYGDKIIEHPVGTGPFRLTSGGAARRSCSRRNPALPRRALRRGAAARRRRWPGAPGALKGRRLPMVDASRSRSSRRAQPRWLAFVNRRGRRWSSRCRAEFTNIAIPNGKLAPNLAKRGITMVRYLRADVAHVVLQHGGPGRRRLHAGEGRAAPRDRAGHRRRRARSALVRRGQAIPAQSVDGAGHSGATTRRSSSEMSEYDPASAKALLDLYGYVDRDGDGWRELPDGKPLVLEYATQPDRSTASSIEQWQKNMDAIGVRIVFRIAQWPEQLKAVARRQAADVGRRLSSRRPRRRGRSSRSATARRRAGQPGALRAAGVDRLLQSSARCPTAPSARRWSSTRRSRSWSPTCPTRRTCTASGTDLAHPWVRRLPPATLFVRDFWQLRRHRPPSGAPNG